MPTLWRARGTSQHDVQHRSCSWPPQSNDTSAPVTIIEHQHMRRYCYTVLGLDGLPTASTHVISEVDKDALSVSSHRTPYVLQLGHLCNITKHILRQLLKDYNPDFVFISGGTSCKQLSRLAGNQEGFEGPDSTLFWEFRRIVADATQE